MSKSLISRAELQAHLDEQLQFIEASTASFDAGFESEAKRLAVAIRVLLHDTPQSHSLLGQLGLKSGTFLDSALPYDPNNPASYHGLISFGGTSKKIDYQAHLDEAPSSKRVPFEDWWTSPVIADQKDQIFCRRDIILTASNQDGGAHVDPKLDDAYAALSRHNSLSSFGMKVDGSAVPIPNPERATIRQIAHEILKSLKPGYQKVQPRLAADEIRIAGLTINIEPASNGYPPTPPSNAYPRKMGRNERCFCGSDRKYKHCHGRHAS